MTVPTQTPTSVQTPGNAVATSFAFPMKVFQTTDLVVGFIVGGVYTVQSPSTYSVQNVDINGGGNVLFATAPPVGTTVDIRSQTPITQSTEFANAGQFLPELHTEAFDRTIRIEQDMYRLTYLYGIHGPDTENTPWPALPAPQNRLGMFLGFDPTTGLPGATVQMTNPLNQSIFNAFLLGAGGANLAGNVELGGPGFTVSGFGPTAGALMVDMTPDFGSFTTNGSGFVTGPTGTVFWVRVGKLVIVALPAIIGTSNFDAFNITNWPAEIQPPTVAQNVVLPGINNSLAAVLLLGISNSPTPIVNVQMSNGTFSASGFAATGTKGFPACTISYLLA